MNSSWFFFLSLILLCLVIQGFYAMVEMACVSFNKVRLQYYDSKKNRRAIWLSYLLNHPTQLFGATLIGNNIALQFGSEFSRHFYLSLGLSPDLAPLTQVFLVLIFAEIVPMIAGRRYAESIAMVGAPLLYASSLILKPLIWLFDLLCKAINKLLGSPGEKGLYLSRDELQNILTSKEEAPSEFNTVVAYIFSLKNKAAKELMQPLNEAQLLSSSATIKEMRERLASHYLPYAPLYHQKKEDIIAIAYPRDLLRASDNKRVREFAKPPWFITEDSSILQIFKQFQKNNQSIAVVLNRAGAAVGILTLDEIVDEIFGMRDSWFSIEESIALKTKVLVEKTLPAEMKISAFNAKFHANLPVDSDAQTLGELVTKVLGHPPAKGESVRIDRFELTVEEVSLRGIKEIEVRTL